MPQLIAIASARWKLEEDHELDKQVAGLDAGLIPVAVPSKPSRSVPSGPVMRPDLRGRLSASDREIPSVTGVNGPPMGPARVVAREGSDAGFPVSRKMVIARYAGWPSCGRNGRFALAGRIQVAGIRNGTDVAAQECY